jgi:hypothetical protein
MDKFTIERIEEILHKQAELLAEDSQNNADSESVRKNTETILMVYNCFIQNL